MDHAGEIFRVWRRRLTSLLVEGGCPASRASGLAALTIAAMEGAVAIARAEGELAAFASVLSQGAAEPRSSAAASATAAFSDARS